MKKVMLLVVVVMMMMIGGCESTIKNITIPGAIKKYKKVAYKIELGQSKEDVLSVLQPTQKGLPADAKRIPEVYFEDGKTIEVYFFRTAHYSNSHYTDDEYVPYVFIDNKLNSVGWTALGGPKTRRRMSPVQKLFN